MEQTRNGHFGKYPDPEDLDKTPLEIPLGACRPEPLASIVARMVRQQVEAKEAAEFESFEESDDFDMPEDDGLLDMSPYEFVEMDEEYLAPPDSPPQGNPDASSEPPQAAISHDPGSDPGVDKESRPEDSAQP